MRQLAALVLIATLVMPGAVRSADDPTPNAPIRDVISGQIEALRLDDFATAFGFASPVIREMFGTEERFGRMVREGYPMVYRPEGLRFGELRERGGRLWQRVIVTDAAGRLHTLDYQMLETDAGWRINGVVLIQAPGAGV